MHAMGRCRSSGHGCRLSAHRGDSRRACRKPATVNDRDDRVKIQPNVLTTHTQPSHSEFVISAFHFRQPGANGPMKLLSRFALSSLGALLGALPATAAAQATDATTVDVAILDVLRARGIIDAAQYEELVALAREKAASASSEIDLIEGRLARLRAPDPSLSIDGGKPGKLVFKSADGKWALGMRGMLQARAEYGNSNDDSKDVKNYSVARGRLAFEGTAGAENVTYKIELNTSTQSTSTATSTTRNFSLEDAWVNWGFESGANLRFGQFKFPFGREELTSSGALEFEDRSIASSQFSPSFEPGAMVHGTAYNGEWEYYIASSNGQGTGASNPSGSNQNGLRNGFRVVYNPLGAFKVDGPAFQTVDDGSTKLGLGFAVNQNSDSTGKNTVTPGADTTTTNLEAQLFSGPWAVLAEHYDRNSDSLPGGASDVNDDGNTVQVGYFLVPNRWELVSRISNINFDAAPDQDEKSIGVNYYVDKHNGKWSLNYNKLDNKGSSPDTDQVQLQYQVIF